MKEELWMDGMTMTPMGEGASIEIGGGLIQGYTVWFCDGLSKPRRIAYTNGEDPNELRDFVWLVRSAATFHHIAFSTVTE